MPGQDPKVLEHLRALFRVELEDQIAVMTEQVAIASNQDAEEEARRLATGELYRAVHSVKGAAAAVAFAEPERICHELEDRLADARNAVHTVDSAQVHGAIAALRDWLHQQPFDPEPTSSGATNVARLPSSVPPSSSKPGDSGMGSSLQGTVRVDRESLDVLLTVTNDWLTRLRTPDLREEELTTALESLADFMAEDSELAEPNNPRRRVARRLLTTVKHHLSEMKLRQRRWEEALFLHGSHVGRLVRSIRLQPASQLLTSLEQASSEIAKSEGKLVEFSGEGGDAKADHFVIERLREPLLQLVRNAVAHGIETPEERRALGKPAVGRVEVSAAAHGTELSIVVTDDGRGIQTDALRRSAMDRGLELPEAINDSELLELVCTSGLSTRHSVDHQAGRGIGMDLVKDRVERLQGRLALQSTPGQGTRILLEVPVDLSLIEVLVVAVGKEFFALPTASVVQLARVNQEQLVAVDGALQLRHRGELLRLSDFGGVFDAAQRAIQKHTVLACVILQAGGQKIAFVVDRLVSVSEYVVKPLDERARVPGARAAVVLADGMVAPLLSAQAVCAEASGGFARWLRAEEAEESKQPRILIVDDSVTTRQLVRIVLESAGYLVEAEADGEKAWARLRGGQRFDAVVTDIEMPGLSGLELLARIRDSARFRELPVVLITALAKDEDKRRALDLGADAYVVKSRFDQQALLETLQELVE